MVVAFVAVKLVVVNPVNEASVPVIESMTPVVARRIEEKKLVVVALPAMSEDEYKFVEVEFVPVAFWNVKF